MIGKNEQADDNDNNSVEIELIANKRKILESNSAQIQQEIQNCFTQLAEALKCRERQLLRQAQAIHTQQLSLIQSSLELLPPVIVNFNEQESLEERIQHFGKIELSGTNCITVKDIEPYKVAYYQEADKDHISFDKSIKHENDLIFDTVDQRNVDVIKLSEHGKCGKLGTNCKNDIISAINSTLCNSMCFTKAASKVGDPPDQLKNCNILPSCSPSLLVRQKLDLTHVPRDIEHEIDAKCSTNLQGNVTNSLFESADDINMHNDQSDKTLNTFVEQMIHKKENFFSQETVVDTYEHPKQVQQWLQQILVETEIEPIIHEVGQFSEISKVQDYNDFQLET